jgi:hypothetical protein
MESMIELWPIPEWLAKILPIDVALAPIGREIRALEAQLAVRGYTTALSARRMPARAGPLSRTWCRVVTC